MSDKLGIGVIGVGTIGSVHTDAYAKVEAAEVVALCDIKPDRLEAKGRQHGIETLYQNYHDLLADPSVQAVSVCVPNALHAPISVDAFRAGKHVMLEKPMAMNQQEATRICQARDAAGKVLQLGMVLRQHANSQVVKDLVSNGHLGEIYHMRVVRVRRRGIPGLGGWFTTKDQSGGGALIDIAVHSFDLALWLSGYWQPSSVSATTYAKFGPLMEDYHYTGMWAGPPDYDGVFDVDDYATGSVRFGRQATMSFEVAWAANTAEESFVELLGDKAGVRIGDSGPVQLTGELDGRLSDTSVQFATQDGFQIEMQRFVEAALGRSEPAATGEQGVVIMKLLDAIYQSSAEAREVTIS